MPLPFFRAYTHRLSRLDAEEALEEVARVAVGANTLKRDARTGLISAWRAPWDDVPGHRGRSRWAGLRGVAAAVGIGVRLVKKAVTDGG